MNLYIYLSFILLISCDKVVDIETNTKFIREKEVVENDIIFNSYFNSIYDDMYSFFNNTQFKFPNINPSIILGALSDEYKLNQLSTNQIINNSYYNSLDQFTPDYFSLIYKIIIRCNTLLEVAEYSSYTNNSIEKIEIRVIRSILYIYLIQLYKKIPLLIVSNIDINLKQKLVDFDVICDFVISELNFCFQNISNEKKYLYSSNFSPKYFSERINKTITSYYLSYIYLLKKDYNNSIFYSNFIIKDYTFEEEFNKKFKLTSKENLWILYPSVNSDYLNNNLNVPIASYLNHKLFPSIPIFSSSYRSFSISDSIVLNMKSNDKRKYYYIDSSNYLNNTVYLMNKYRSVGNFDLLNDEKFIIIRLPHVYFNLIESYYQIGNIDSSLYYFNLINSKNYFEYINQTSIDIHDIARERSFEFFGELGDRWFTLKRTKLIDSVMNIFTNLKSQNSIQWNNSKQFLPILQEHYELNPNLK